LPEHTHMEIVKMAI
jgi:hypothetical protein